MSIISRGTHNEGLWRQAEAEIRHIQRAKQETGSMDYRPGLPSAADLDAVEAEKAIAAKSRPAKQIVDEMLNEIALAEFGKGWSELEPRQQGHCIWKATLRFSSQQLEAGDRLRKEQRENL